MQKQKKRQKCCVTDGPTDRRTDQLTDGPVDRPTAGFTVASTWLKRNCGESVLNDKLSLREQGAVGKNMVLAKKISEQMNKSEKERTDKQAKNSVTQGMNEWRNNENM